MLHVEISPAVGLISSSIVGTGKRICFAAEVESEIPRQLHRAPTPYPKELRNLARHARNLHHQSAHDQRVSIMRFLFSPLITFDSMKKITKCEIKKIALEDMDNFKCYRMLLFFFIFVCIFTF